MQLAKLLPLAAIGLLGCAGGETEYPDAVTADPNHYAVEFENDVVRVLRTTYGAGERSVMHHHPQHCAVSLSSGNWRMTPAEGEVADLPMEVGGLYCVEAGAHLPENASGADGEAILFEFKEEGTAGMGMSQEHPGAVAADPDHYSVEFENEVARILRITYGAGETSTMHYHPANCSVDLTGATWRMTGADGTVTEEPGSVGTVDCGDAAVHLPENPSEDQAEVILVEFKGRETFN